MSRSLGVLTIDMVAKIAGFEQGLDKAERAASKRTKAMNKMFSDFGTKVGIALGAAATGAVAIAASTANAAREITNLSRLTNTGVEQFQAMAIAARTVGIEQDKLADIFKDTQDKVGDFINTGGGALTDFFERIAPLVGVTAEQFRELSGPDALQLYFSSLEKANVSQSDMVFFMEAIASDSALLAPLLRNNGEAFAQLGEEARKSGAVMSDVQVEAGLQLRKTMDDLQLAITGAKNAIGAEMTPVLMDLAALVKDDDFQSGFKFIVGIFADMAEGAAIVTKAIGGLVGSDARIDRINEKLIKLKRELNDPNFFTNEDLLRRQIAALEKQRAAIVNAAQLPAPTAGAPSPAGMPSTSSRPAAFSKEAEDSAKKLIGQYDSLANSLREQIILYGDTSKAAKVRYDVENGELAKLTQAQKDQLIAQAEQLDMLDAMREEQAFSEDQASRLDDLRDRYQLENEVILEAYQERYADLETFRQLDLLSEEEYNQLKLDNELEFARQQAEIQDMRLQSAQSMFGSLSSIAANFAGEQSGIARAMFAVEKAIGIARSIVAIQTGIAQAAALPFPANLGAMASVAAATASIVSTIAGTNPSFDGGGYTGAGSRTGGLDGKGGFMAMLHPNETVIDHTRGQGMGGDVVVNMVEDASRAGQVNKRMDNGQQIIDVVVANIRSGGQVWNTMATAGGLSRRGR